MCELKYKMIYPRTHNIWLALRIENWEWELLLNGTFSFYFIYLCIVFYICHSHFILFYFIYLYNVLQISFSFQTEVVSPKPRKTKHKKNFLNGKKYKKCSGRVRSYTLQSLLEHEYFCATFILNFRWIKRRQERQRISDTCYWIPVLKLPKEIANQVSSSFVQCKSTTISTYVIIPTLAASCLFAFLLKFLISQI